MTTSKLSVAVRQIARLQIHGIPFIEDVSISFEHHAPGNGRVVLVAEQNAWTMLWNNLDTAGHETVQDRFMATSIDGLLRSIYFGTPEILHRARSREDSFIAHVLANVKTALTAQPIDVAALPAPDA